MSQIALVAPFKARQAAAPAPPQGRLRLTARGRFVLIVLPVVTAVALLVSFLIAFNQSASASETALPGAGVVKVSVMQGDTLWGIAREAAPQRDTRDTIQDIRDLNPGLGQLHPGDVVLVPAGA